MRPEALEISGFTVFRDREPSTRLDFADADLFAFTGPTGAGKSSLIDAMIFALYGSVPRLGEKAVAPVISQGQQDARIRLDFALGERRYTAVRVVRRNSRGTATTREARLQCGDEVLAGNVHELDAAVERLIGLDFRQFTTCAVLPQGDFARFLHARPAERQKLLTQLLGFAVYGAMRQQAKQRAAIGRDRMATAANQLAGLTGATKKTEKAQAARLTALQELQEHAAGELSRMKKLQGEIDAIAPRRERIAQQMRALRDVRLPENVPQLASDLLAAERAVQVAEQALTQAPTAVASAEEKRDALGDKDELLEWRRLHGDHRRLEGDLKQAQGTTERARTEDVERLNTLDKESRAAESADDALEAARRSNAAHELRGHLVPGESCPVCGQTVVEPARGETPTVLAELEVAERETRSRRDAAQKEQRKSAQSLAGAMALELRIEEQLDTVSKRLADASSLGEIETLLQRFDAADEVVRKAKETQGHISKALIGAQRNQKTVAKRETAAWAAYNDARNALALAGLTPASPRTDDLPGSWEELETWATQAMPGLTERDDALGCKAEELMNDMASARNRLSEHFATQEVAFDDDPLAHLREAVTQARIDLAKTRAQRKEKKHLRAEIRRTKSQVDVADTLAGHLRADGFERWLLQEAFGRLSSSASRLLVEVSNGQYALRHNDRLEFEVIDHSSAGEARSARTLSGGETFLASLSLALALADEVADLATEGTARLESIFLDEGFGTLDADTLDVVATAIEELGARGRVVGVVTHVAALAERIPVQFKVTKASGNASVQRIDT